MYSTNLKCATAAGSCGTLAATGAPAVVWILVAAVLACVAGMLTLRHARTSRAR